jgi:hypothetical protein
MMFLYVRTDINHPKEKAMSNETKRSCKHVVKEDAKTEEDITAVAQVWAAEVDLKLLGGKTLNGAVGAITMVFTLARDEEEFLAKLKAMASVMGMYAAQVYGAGPLTEEAARWLPRKALEVMIRQATSDPDAVIHNGLAHYRRDDEGEEPRPGTVIQVRGQAKR